MIMCSPLFTAITQQTNIIIIMAHERKSKTTNKNEYLDVFSVMGENKSRS